MVNMKKKIKNTDEKKKNIVGRPSKFTPLNIKQAEKSFKLGLTDKQVSDVLDVNESTLNRWKTEHPEFRKSLKSWKDEADEPVERGLYSRAAGFTGPDDRYYPPDPTSMIFWLKNRKPAQWRDKVDVEHSGDLILNYGHRKQK